MTWFITPTLRVSSRCQRPPLAPINTKSTPPPSNTPSANELYPHSQRWQRRRHSPTSTATMMCEIKPSPSHYTHTHTQHIIYIINVPVFLPDDGFGVSVYDDSGSTSVSVAEPGHVLNAFLQRRFGGDNEDELWYTNHPPDHSSPPSPITHTHTNTCQWTQRVCITRTHNVRGPLASQRTRAPDLRPHLRNNGTLMCVRDARTPSNRGGM